ncbi:MAG: CHAP domain-containing protein [Patescibacteria group bacterium]|nr:CHAP domain-containing protein [Patescibacteria group bacterium]
MASNASPIVFVSDDGNNLFRFEKGRKKVFDQLKSTGVITDAGVFSGLPSPGVREQLANSAIRELARDVLTVRLRRQIFAHLSARTSLPFGFGAERLSSQSKRAAKKLANRVSGEFVSGYLAATAQGKSSDESLKIARARATQKISEVFSDPQFRKPLGKALREDFEDIFPEDHSPEKLQFQRSLIDTMEDGAAEALRDAPVHEVSLEESEETGVRLEVSEVGTLRREKKSYYPVPAEDEIDERLKHAHRDLVREIKDVEEAELEFDLSYYGIDESEAAKYWLARVWKGKLFRTALHVVAPPLERLFYKKLKIEKPAWLKELEKSKRSDYIRKKMEDLAWKAVRNHLLTIPIFVDEHGHRYSLFSWKHDSEGRREKTYFTPFAFVAGWWKKRRHSWADAIDRAANRKKGAVFLQSAKKVLSPHLRRKRKDGSDDDSSAFWWLAKGAAKAVWVLARPLAVAASRALGLPTLQAALVRKWYAIETGGGFAGNLLRFIRHGKYWGQAAVAGVKGGLGYGLAGYLMTGSPYGALAFGGVGLAGKALSYLATHSHFMALAGQPGISGAVAGFLKSFHLPVYSVTASGQATATSKVFSLFHIPVVGPTLGSGVGYIVGSTFGYPRIGAAFGFVGGFGIEYGAVVLSRVTSNIVWPQLVAAHPILAHLAFLKHWQAGLVGAGVGYVSGRALGLPHWASLITAGIGFLVFSGAAYGIHKALSALFSTIASKLGITGPIGLYIGGFGFGAWQGAKLGMRMGLPPWGVLLMSLGGGLLGAGAVYGTLWGIKTLFARGIIEAVVVKIGAAFASFFSGVWAGLGGILASATLASVAFIAILVLTVVGVTIAAVVSYDQYKAWQPGVVQSRYLMLTKRAEPDEPEAGDEIIYTVELSAREKIVEDIKLRDTQVFYESPLNLPMVRYLNPCYPEDECPSMRPCPKEGGIEIVGGPEPDNVNVVQTPGCTKAFFWDIGRLDPGDTFTVSYKVAVDEYYKKEFAGAIKNTVETVEGTVEGMEETVGPVPLYLNAEGSEALAATAQSLSDCLRDGSTSADEVVYNQYYSECDYFNTCSRAKSQFDASISNHGFITCVNFVVAAMHCSDVNVPHAGDAHTWYTSYQGQDGFLVYPNGSAQPQEGDILVFSGGPTGDGHIGVIVEETDSSVRYAHANTSTRIGTKAIVDGKIEASSGYEIPGFIRVLK